MAKKAEFEIWLDYIDFPSSGGASMRAIQNPVDGKHNIGYPQEKFEARQTAKYFATNGVWISATVLIPPSQITRVYLKRVANEAKA